MNKTFATLSREIDRDNYLERVQVAFVCKDTYKRFPDDEEFRRELVVKDIYNFRNRNYILRKLENYERTKELVNIEEYTIEHIMPQNPKLSKAWQTELGENWKEIQAKYLHTIGNLTLTGYNSELSDRPFLEKRDLKDGFADSPLRLNRMLAKLEKWNETEIKKRAEALADRAIKVWVFPSVHLESQNLNIRELLLDVFPNNEYLTVAKTYIQKVFDVIGHDKAEHILSITFRNEKAISVNLGQWVVLRFRRKAGELEALFAIDFEQYKDVSNIGVYKIHPFSSRWAIDKDIRLVWFHWNHLTNLPDLFIEAWCSAILYAYQMFRSWRSSSYMIYHQPELARLLVAETDRNQYTEYLQGEILELFEAIRKRILNLDASVREEFKKLYIAYKTTTNFVDIVPQRSRLRLSLNIRLEEINDPKGLCRDVTNVGRWGNGDVEVGLSALSQIDDVMFLVRQAFNKYNEDLTD